MADLPINYIFSSDCTGAGSSKQEQDSYPPIENSIRKFNSGDRIYYSVYGKNSYTGAVVEQIWYKRVRGVWTELTGLYRKTTLGTWTNWQWNNWRDNLEDGVFCVSYRYNGNDFADIYFSVGVRPEDINVNVIESWVKPTEAIKLDTVEYYVEFDGINEEHIGSINGIVRDKDGVEYNLSLVSRPSFGWPFIDGKFKVACSWLEGLMLTPPVDIKFIALNVDSSKFLICFFKEDKIIGIFSDILEIIDIFKPAIMEPFIKGSKIK